MWVGDDMFKKSVNMELEDGVLNNAAALNNNQVFIHSNAEFEILVLEAMESDSILKLTFRDYVRSIVGTVHYINHLKSQIIVQDRAGYFYHIALRDLANIQLYQE